MTKKFKLEEIANIYDKLHGELSKRSEFLFILIFIQQC